MSLLKLNRDDSVVKITDRSESMSEAEAGYTVLCSYFFLLFITSNRAGEKTVKVNNRVENR